ncbi:MAG: formylglycine-generating enzyme family protein, partial [Planctomycetes bacterium]|nr:formylglycine-generating enzyme family protein [Planctomycetota bacterium]
GGLAGNRFPWGNTISHSQGNYYSCAEDESRCCEAYDVSPTREYHPDYNDSVYPFTSPVDSFAPKGYGLYDMAGNVWEWCWDRYDQGWYRRTGASAADPRGPGSGSNRVVRGGGWVNDPFNLRCAYRDGASPDFRYRIYGFRWAQGQPFAQRGRRVRGSQSP